MRRVFTDVTSPGMKHSGEVVVMKVCLMQMCTWSVKMSQEIWHRSGRTDDLCVNVGILNKWGRCDVVIH